MFEKASCPLDEERANQLIEMMTSIDARLRKIERYMFVGRIVASTVIAVAVSLGWFWERAEEIRASLKNFLG